MSATKIPDPIGHPPNRRKLIAVMHADMAGYSRLIGLDDLGTLDRLRVLRKDLIDPAVEEHGGRIVNTGGDSLLIVFDSIDGAVRCAVRVQEQVPTHDGDQPPDRAIRFRVGINAGDVIPDGTDIHGDVVNVAARLQVECPPGGICVSRSVHDHVRDRLNLAFEELGPLNLKNIARPVEAFVLWLDSGASTSKFAEPSRVTSTHEALTPDKPSMAVLPFSNLSSDPEQEYFSDGVADDIITELSRSRSLFVIARNSSFTYKGHAVDVKRVARELGVRYVLEGSVRRSGQRVRVVAQLIDAVTGNHIWAERYDRALEDVFAVQDEITASVVTAIVPAVADAELERILRKPPESLGAWEAYQRGRWHEGLGTTAEHERAKEFFQRAITLDPTFASPYFALAVAYINDGGIYATLPLAEAAKLSADWAQKAITIDPQSADAQSAMAYAAMVAGNSIEAQNHLRLAQVSNPNLPPVLACQGFVLLFSGHFSQARDALTECLRLDPRGPGTALRLQLITVSYYYEHDYAKAVEAARHTVARYPRLHLTYRWLAAALGQLGCTEEAQVALRTAIELSPQSFEFYVRNRPPWHKLENHEHMLDGLRKAGWQG
jgi:adenylate cyclase